MTPKSRILGMLCCVSVIVVALGASSAARPRQASSAPLRRCGDGWNGSDSCSFRYKGGPLSVSLSLAGAPVGAAAVRLENEPARGVRTVLLNCKAAGFYSACTAVTTERSDPLAPEEGDRLFCIVDGAGGRGRYACSSG